VTVGDSIPDPSGISAERKDSNQESNDYESVNEQCEGIGIGKKFFIVACINGQRPLEKDVTEGDKEHARFYKEITAGKENSTDPRRGEEAKKHIEEDIESDVCFYRIKRFNHGS